MRGSLEWKLSGTGSSHKERILGHGRLLLRRISDNGVEAVRREHSVHQQRRRERRSPLQIEGHNPIKTGLSWLCAAGAAMHPVPQSSSPSIFQPSSGMRQSLTACPSVPEEHPAGEDPNHFPVSGEWVSGNLWNVSTLEQHIPGPLGTWLRHTTAMHSPVIPGTYENVIAHQAFLEKLHFEQTSLRSWSNTVQDQIMEKLIKSMRNWRE